MELKDNYLLVAAIDFGTTYTGYAYSTRKEFQTDPVKINMMTWNAGSGGLVSQKTSTCVLFKPDGTFHSFGYEAEDYYNELVMDDNYEDWFFFRCFKMELYKDHIDRNYMLRTSDGKEMSAIKIISAVIGYLRGHLMETINARGVAVSDPDIRWVVTVPAIWSDAAKQMMREAVERTGIAGNQLILVLEPEAAAMLCKNLPEVQLFSEGCTDKVETFRSGAKYMVFDAGGDGICKCPCLLDSADLMPTLELYLTERPCRRHPAQRSTQSHYTDNSGTIDITVHEVLKGGFLIEIHAANGGDWGGTKVDEAFEEFLESIVGKAAFEHFKVNEIPSVIDMHRNFEVKKRTFTGKDVGTKTTICVPYSLLETFKEYNPGKQIANAIEVSHCSTDVEWKKDKIRLSQKKTLTLFEKSFKHITDHVSDILSNPEVKACDAILMVGGYSECLLLQDAIRTVAEEIRLIVPSEASLAVLKGAVINGHCPDIVSERVCKYTYGIATRYPFAENRYDKYRIVDEDGEIKCDNCFAILAKKGLPVKIGESSISRSFIVAYSTATSITFQMFASTAKIPKYVTDNSCQKIGQMTLLMPDTSLGKDRGANITMYFGGSEIELTAVDKNTGRKISACFDFLG